MNQKLAKIKLKSDWPKDFVPDEIREFKSITKNFPEMLNNLTEKSCRLSIYDYFGKSGIGKSTSRNFLKSTISQLEKSKDFKGIYVFWLNNEPFYTGISRGVIKRLHQHIKGTNHFSSSLCYSMGKQYHHDLLNIEHKGRRKEMDFKRFSEPFKKILNEQCLVSLLPIQGSTELYLFEVYVAIQLKLHFYNRFKTH